MSEQKEIPEHAGVKHIPPKIFIGLLAAGMFLHVLLPLELSFGIAMRGLGVLIVVLSFAWAYWCVSLFKQHKTALPPNQPTTAIIKTGPFAISRNPIYLAMLSGLVGIALMSNIVWLWLCPPIMYYYLMTQVIAKEEAYLSRVFTMEYLDYQRKVRRWL